MPNVNKFVSVILCAYAKVNAQSLLSLTAQANPICSNLCNSNTGAISVDVQGGTPPYTFIWSNGLTDQSLTGLQGGPYDVTVTDAVLSTAYSSTWLGDSPVPDLNLGSIVMPTPGMNNGRIDFYSFGFYVPDANYAFELYDSSFTLINSYYNNCVQCQNPVSWAFTGLGKGTSSWDKVSTTCGYNRAWQNIRAACLTNSKITFVI